MDKDGLVLGQNLNTTPVESTMSATTLTNNNNGTTISSPIENIINVGNLNLNGTDSIPTITISPKTTGYLLLANIPTSSTGLPSGAVWNDNGTLKIA